MIRYRIFAELLSTKTEFLPNIKNPHNSQAGWHYYGTNTRFY